MKLKVIRRKEDYCPSYLSKSKLLRVLPAWRRKGAISRVSGWKSTGRRRDGLEWHSAIHVGSLSFTVRLAFHSVSLLILRKIVLLFRCD